MCAYWRIITYRVSRLSFVSFPRPGKSEYETIKRLHRRFGEEGITIPFPIRTLDVPDAFRVRQEEAADGA